MKYKDKWISNATDEELSAEREKVRQDFCNPNLMIIIEKNVIQRWADLTEK